MEFIFFVVGLLIGVTITLLIKRRDKVHGFIEIDHETEMVRFRITSTEIADYKNKKAIFEIKHDGNISRE